MIDSYSDNKTECLIENSIKRAFSYYGFLVVDDVKGKECVWDYVLDDCDEYFDTDNPMAKYLDDDARDKFADDRFDRLFDKVYGNVSRSLGFVTNRGLK